MSHLIQFIVAFLLYFVVTYVFHFAASRFTTLTAIIIPAGFTYGIVALFTPHDSFGVRILYVVGVVGAAFVQHFFGKTLDKLNV
jgi:hypothetical protein